MTITRMKNRWYHGANFLTREKNAFDIVLYTLLGYMTTVGGKLVIAIVNDDALPLEQQAFFFLLIASYIVCVYFREELFPKPNNTHMTALDPSTYKDLIERLKQGTSPLPHEEQSPPAYVAVADDYTSTDTIHYTTDTST